MQDEYPKTKMGVVIFLDALGVKGLGIEKSHQFLKKRDQFLIGVKKIRDIREKQFKEGLNIDLPDPEIVVFQDSLIICFEKTSNDKLPLIITAAQWISDAFNCAILSKLFLRGSISQGEYIFDSSEKNVTIIGPAIDDAHTYCELADWIGVMLTPDCEKKYLSGLKIIAMKENVSLDAVIDYYHFLLVQYPIPIHKGKTENDLSKKKYFVVSWPQLTYWTEKKGGDRTLKILLKEQNRPVNSNFCFCYSKIDQDCYFNIDQP